MYSKAILLIIVYFLIGCGAEKTEQNNREVKANQMKTEDFNAFLKKFSVEEDFQLSRIKYPLTSKYYDVDSDKPTIVITQEKDREFNSFNNKKFIKKITQENPRKYILNIQIDDTGVYVDFIFELINGKWFLTMTIDTST